jgi:hypothetical protein
MRQLLQGAHLQLKESAKQVTLTQQELAKRKEENLEMKQEIQSKVRRREEGEGGWRREEGGGGWREMEEEGTNRSWPRGRR